ncbi:hypothetical protein TPB0596_00550 [Tsukamurella pulmonis]|nr:hypothetical protein TPB0596_00550 [Tsukamurella pulmonis]
MCVVFVVVGLGAVVPGIFQWRQDQAFLRNSVAAEGVVVGYATDERTQTKTYQTTKYQREIEYEARGRTYRRMESGTSTSVPTLGDHVTVYYDNEDPANAVVDTLGRRWMGQAIVLSGVFWAGLWLAVLVVLGRRGRAATPD